MIHRLLSLIILLHIILHTSAQQKATILGTITDRNTDEPIEFLTVFVQGTQNATETDEHGKYRIQVDPEKEFILNFTRVGFKPYSQAFVALSPGAVRELDVALVPIDSDLEIIITERQIEEAGMVREDVQELKLLPTTTGNLESVLPHIALGTSSGTGGELSSQYNVRGGNYDENLVYVNDFEIYRPQLIRSSQQEGLSFPNIDLLRDLSFSSGGFEAKYGDKMSSVLDIYYKRPDTIHASAAISLLGASAHVEGSLRSKINPYRHLRVLTGVRYKTTQNLLSSLDIHGEYAPKFVDVQSYITYDLSRSLQLGVMGNYNSSIYNFEPVSRQTAQGLIDFALQLTSTFEGHEVDDFITGMGGVSLTYIPDKERNPLYLKFLASGYQSRERENLDIAGAYRLSQIETGLGSEDAGEEILVLGTGIQHEFTRDVLTSQVATFEQKGGVEFQLNHAGEEKGERTHFFQWGVKAQREDIFDKINEWERLDSAGYSLPYDPNEVRLISVLKSRNDLESLRFSSFIEDTYTRIQSGKYEMKLTGGVRVSYWDLNDEVIFSPRAQFLYKPLQSKNDISFRIAAGLYNQPPFYREMRRPDGTVNSKLLAQKSFHVVGGWTVDFGPDIRGRKRYRMITEMYYKRLWDLVRYDINNVRIRYSGENDARGYVMGLDVRLNGEFVPGAESWINLSILRARESLDGITHMKREVGEAEGTAVNDVPRPTDQLVNLNVFFQDYLPKNENFKVHLNLSIGTGLAFGFPDDNIVYRNTYRYSAYRRLDIGFSILLWDQSWRNEKPNHYLKFCRNSWVSLEVFNLPDIRNEASKTWIKAIDNSQYAIGNFLTGRRLNVRWKFEF
ncbi:MAG TPA: carboxypeptidase-like regulatory domain-containing protein [Saprospiraceae bacterium]|nr:carboxypeptidase-like regulatory domain-containing protein [Saprospiraceae bacterium]